MVENVMAMRSLCMMLAAVAGMAVTAGAQPAGANYDESKVPRYTLPDPLTLNSGEKVRDAQTWTRKRRPEVMALFETQMFGRSPGRPGKMSFEPASLERAALGGRAIRKEITVLFTGSNNGPKMSLLLYLPANAAGPVPVFLGLNFTGNHTVSADPGIRLPQVWSRDGKGKRSGREDERGASASRWQVEKVLAHGYGLATVYYGDIEPDYDGGIAHGVRPAFYRKGQIAPAADEWGAIAAWAWGLSRALDYLETDRQVDAKRVAVMGHSRLGKTALWAGARDERFSIVISVNSGEGGAAISRRMFGENVKDLNTRFPHWFCANYRQFNDRVDEMPFDQHELVALVAPRPVYIASAEEDLWADPKGEFLAGVAAGPVYRLLGGQDLGTDRMPGIHPPLMGTIGYHIRAGKHDVTAYDWEQFLSFADKHWKKD